MPVELAPHRAAPAPRAGHLELYRALDEDAQREIQNAAEEKKRLKALESHPLGA